MHWQGMPLLDNEDMTVLFFNPLKRRFSTGEVLTAPGTDSIYTFNRLYLDHCMTSESTEQFPLFTEELDTALIFELRGITLQSLAPLQQELNCRTLFGYHCQGLIGHCIVTLSQGRMIGLTTDDLTFQAQFGTLTTETAEAVHEDHMEVTEAGTATVTIGRLPLGCTVTVNVRMD